MNKLNMGADRKSAGKHKVESIQNKMENDQIKTQTMTVPGSVLADLWLHVMSPSLTEFPVYFSLFQGADPNPNPVHLYLISRSLINVHSFQLNVNLCFVALFHLLQCKPQHEFGGSNDVDHVKTYTAPRKCL